MEALLTQLATSEGTTATLAVVLSIAIFFCWKLWQRLEVVRDRQYSAAQKNAEANLAIATALGSLQKEIGLDDRLSRIEAQFDRTRNER